MDLKETRLTSEPVPENSNGVGWVDKPNVSDGLWIGWVCNPTYPLIAC